MLLSQSSVVEFGIVLNQKFFGVDQTLKVVLSSLCTDHAIILEFCNISLYVTEEMG